MCSFIHGSPQSAGHPLVAHFNNIFAAGYLSTSLQGNMSPCTLSGNLLCVSVNWPAFACFHSGVADSGCNGVLRFTPKTDGELINVGGSVPRFGAGLAFDVYGLGCLVQDTVVIVIVRRGLCPKVN